MLLAVFFLADKDAPYCTTSKNVILYYVEVLRSKRQKNFAHMIQDEIALRVLLIKLHRLKFLPTNRILSMKVNAQL